MSSRPLLAPLALALGAFGIGAFGCSANVGAETGTAGTSQRLALIDVRVQQSPVEGRLERFDASARFVSIKEPGGSAEALDLLGLGWAPVSVGACTAIGSESVAPPAAAHRVDLRDLSPVALELRGDDGISTSLRLEPRAFPDVVGLVSGVVFVAPADVVSALASPPHFAAVDAGGIHIPGLELPNLPARVQLVDAVATPRSPGSASADPEPVTYAVGRTLDVVTSGVAGDDRIAIDVVRAGVVRARCGVDAAGKVRIDLGIAGETSLIVRSQRRVLRDDAALGPIEARLERDLELKLLVR